MQQKDKIIAVDEFVKFESSALQKVISSDDQLTYVKTRLPPRFHDLRPIDCQRGSVLKRVGLAQKTEKIKETEQAAEYEIKPEMGSITEIQVCIKLPEIKLKKKYRDMGMQIAWTRNIAHHVVEQIKFYVKSTSEFEFVFDTYSLDNCMQAMDFDSKRGYSYLIGNRPEIIDWQQHIAGQTLIFPLKVLPFSREGSAWPADCCYKTDTSLFLTYNTDISRLLRVRLPGTKLDLLKQDEFFASIDIEDSISLTRRLVRDKDKAFYYLKHNYINLKLLCDHGLFKNPVPYLVSQFYSIKDQEVRRKMKIERFYYFEESKDLPQAIKHNKITEKVDFSFSDPLQWMYVMCENVQANKYNDHSNYSSLANLDKDLSIDVQGQRLKCFNPLSFLTCSLGTADRDAMISSQWLTENFYHSHVGCIPTDIGYNAYPFTKTRFWSNQSSSSFASSKSMEKQKPSVSLVLGQAEEKRVKVSCDHLINVDERHKKITSSYEIKIRFHVSKVLVIENGKVQLLKESV